MIKIILPLSIFTILVSCSTLSEKECKSADWSTLGHSDGSKGYKLSRLNKHNKACSEYGIQVNATAYKDGYKSGLKSYCEIDRALQLGLDGKSYKLLHLYGDRFSQKPVMIIHIYLDMIS
jgi:hypothetical protein